MSPPDQLAALTDSFHEPIGNAITGVRLISRHLGIPATNLNPRPPPYLNFHEIMERNGLVNRTQFVKTIVPNRANGKTKIDLGVGTERRRH